MLYPMNVLLALPLAELVEQPAHNVPHVTVNLDLLSYTNNNVLIPVLKATLA